MGWTDKLAEMLRLNDGEQAYVGYPQMQVGLNKPRQSGYVTGFLEGATGMESMQPKNPITDPNFSAYEQGKNTGEAVGIGAMALPGYAMALRASAPKAYNALENYMVKSGGMIPFEAYHGTPHKIEGGFDINKVGIGEGNQVFGHGMYFAENPAVANTYRTIQPSGGSSPYTRRTFQGVELTPQTPEYHAAHMVDKMGVKKAKAEFQDWLNNPPDYADESLKANWQKSLDTLNNAKKKSDFGTLPFEGNLYKVDIPDEHIANMLNWDEKVPEDLRKRISAATMEQFGNGATGTSGEHLYKEIVFEMRRNGSKAPEADASKWLNEHGVPGIRYLDQASRAKGGTSNFVVFDPSTVKILEENSKPLTRKEILEQELKKRVE